MTNEMPVSHLTVDDPKLEPGHLSRTRLLRRAADAIERLGSVDVHNLVMHQKLTDGKWVPEWVSSISIYYSSLMPANFDARQLGKKTADRAGRTAFEKRGLAVEHVSSAMLRDATTHAFYLRNIRGESEYLSVPRLLRRAADAVDSSKVEIDDLVLHTEVTVEGRVPTVAVYFSRPSRSVLQSRKEWERYERAVEHDMKTERRSQGRSGNRNR